MIRRKRLTAALDAALAPVREEVGTLTQVVAIDLADANRTALSKVAAAEQRVTAATAQAESRVAAVRAELADAKRQSIGDAITMLRRDLDNAQRSRDNYLRKADELVGQLAEANRRAELAEIERDEARRQHDEQRAYALQGWRQAIDNARVIPAARAVLPDLAHGLPSQPKGGSRSRAKARMDTLAALVNPTDDDKTTTNQEAAA